MAQPMKDWTIGPDGRSNSSHAFEVAVTAVADLLRYHTLGTSVDSTAGLILALLAHRLGFSPATEQPPSVDAVDPHAGSTGKLSTRDKGL